VKITSKCCRFFFLWVILLCWGKTLYSKSVIDTTIYFQENEAKLIQPAALVLDDTISILKSNPKKVMKVLITGHADSLEKNPDTLSIKRVKQVENYLLKHGISAESLEIKGVGASRPVAAPGDKRNRRVEFDIKEAD